MSVVTLRAEPTRVNYTGLVHAVDNRAGNDRRLRRGYPREGITCEWRVCSGACITGKEIDGVRRRICT